MAVETPPASAGPAVTNGAPRAPQSTFKQITTLLERHAQLGLLEGQYEIVQAGKRAAALAACAVLAVTLYVLLHVAILAGLVALGLPLWAAALILMFVYAVAIGVIYAKVGRRDAKAGAPFEASRAEWKRSAEWIRKRFF